MRGPSARIDQLDRSVLRLSAPTSSRPPRTSASPAIIARLSSNLTAPLGSFPSATIQPSSIRFSAPNRPRKRRFGLVRVDFVAEAARRAEREAEEFELVGGGPGAVGEQLEALLPHVRIVFVGEQLDAVVERPDRRHQIVAQARAQQAGEIDRVHGRVDGAGSGLQCKQARKAIETPRARSHIRIRMGGIQTIDVRLEPGHAGWRLDRALADCRADPVARAAEGADPERRGRAAGQPVRDPAIKVRGDEALRPRRPRARAGA